MMMLVEQTKIAVRMMTMIHLTVCWIGVTAGAYEEEQFVGFLADQHIIPSCT